MFVTPHDADIFGMSPNDFVISPNRIYIREAKEPQTSKIEEFANAAFDSVVFSVKAAVVLTAVTVLAPVALTAAAVGAPFVVIGAVIVAALVAKAAAVVLSAAVVFGALAVVITAKIVKTAALFILFGAVFSMILAESKSEERFVPENQRVRYSKPRIETQVQYLNVEPLIKIIEAVAEEQAPITEAVVEQQAPITEAVTVIAAGTLAGFATFLGLVAIQHAYEAVVTELAAPAIQNVVLSVL